MDVQTDDQTPKEDILRFYELIDELTAKHGGIRKLRDCSASLDWPKRGVYFFFEPGEVCSFDQERLRVVRVGTHAITAGARRTLWSRLRQHKGTVIGYGNHRASVFRKHVGNAMINSQQTETPVTTWNNRSKPSGEALQLELTLEHAVTKHIGEMPFTWLEVDDDPSPASMRAYIERCSIALLSTAAAHDMCKPSTDWLGMCSPAETIRVCGLWNVEYVGSKHDACFLDKLERWIAQPSPS